jgi:release factor glutamine methyltransferase
MKRPPVTAQIALRAGAARLNEAGIANATGDARALLAHAMGLDLGRLTLHLHDALTLDAAAKFDGFITARARHQPVAQIIGQRMFWGRNFCVTQDTLDPRPETETLIAAALGAPFTSVLDLGTGTGCILITLLAERPTARGLGVDISPDALKVAARNAQALCVDGRAQFAQSDWFRGLPAQPFDLIVSNPPYIAAAEMAGLAPDVALWEPHLALSPGGDGLAPYRSIAATARQFMAQGGRILLEIGPTQGQAVAGYLGAAGFDDITILPDFDGRPRVVGAKNT